MSIVEMVSNLQSAFYRECINIDADEYAQGWDSWFNGLSNVELIQMLEFHGEPGE